MSAWPTLDELKQVLDVGETEEWDGAATTDTDETRLTRLLGAAIDYVKSEVGDWDEDVDEPTRRQSQAALRMAELLALKPEIAAAVAGTDRGAAGVASDPVYQALIRGSRRKFGFS